MDGRYSQGDQKDQMAHNHKEWRANKEALLGTGCLKAEKEERELSSFCRETKPIKYLDVVGMRAGRIYFGGIRKQSGFE